MSPAQIGRQFDSSGQAVRLWLDFYDVKSWSAPPDIICNVRGRGYRHLVDYFLDRWDAGFKVMSKELEVSRATVETYYKVFVAERTTEGSHV